MNKSVKGGNDQAVRWDVRKQRVRFLGQQDRRLAALDHMLRTPDHRVVATTWPTTSQAKSILTAARCCLTLGVECVFPRLST